MPGSRTSTSPTAGSVPATCPRRGWTTSGPAASEAGVEPAAISAIRRSVIDAADADANLAYSHRTLDAAARLGVGVVSFGLHQDLTRA